MIATIIELLILLATGFAIGVNYAKLTWDEEAEIEKLRHKE